MVDRHNSVIEPVSSASTTGGGAEMNRYLHDNFAPVHEELTAFDLEVTGTIPDHLDGRYLRNGPNPATDPGPDFHWFTGAGMVHGVRLGDGRAQWYRNRWVHPTGDDFAPNTN